MQGAGFMLVVLVAALGAIAAKSTDWPAKPGTPGYRVPWNRPTRDSVVDLLLPDDLGERFEFREAACGPRGIGPSRACSSTCITPIAVGSTGARRIQRSRPWPAACARGPGGGFEVRTHVPGMYEGPPHMPFEVSLRIAAGAPGL